MVGTNGGKFPAIRQHLVENIGKVYKDMDTTYDRHASPSSNELNTPLFFAALMHSPKATSSIPKLVSTQLLRHPSHSQSRIDKDAINKLSPGDAVVIFTPDSKSRNLSWSFNY